VTPLALGDGEVATLMDKFNAACAEHPDMPRPKVMILMHAYCAETENELQEGAENIEEFYHYFAKWFRNNGPTPNGFVEPVTDEERAMNPQYSAENMRKNMLIGTPEQIIERLKAYEALGYDEFSIWVDSHMSFAQKSKSIQLFIDKVLPAFN
jgi:alkanesulfonate monooxygenase SsuD/methylene tetrahydromethanopterin reductase-like flavin-dependent oxidoreductase (luciferase family)